jgi:molybdate transport system substrate-binding protein
MATRQVAGRARPCLPQRQAASRSASSRSAASMRRKRVAAGEPFDVVVLAADAIDKLIAGGSVLADSAAWIWCARRSPSRCARARRSPTSSARTTLASRRARSMAAWAIPPVPAARHCLRSSNAGASPAKLRDRLVKAPAGVPVAQLVADGRVGARLPAIERNARPAGDRRGRRMPAGCEIVTTFSGGVCADVGPARGGARAARLACNRPPAAEPTPHGMDPAQEST